MGLSLNNIYQRPYVKQDTKAPVKKNAKKMKNLLPPAPSVNKKMVKTQKAKGLQYVETKQPAYTPCL